MENSIQKGVRSLDLYTLFSLLYKSYLKARKNKRYTHNQLKFEVNLESNLLKLARELLNRTYKPSPSICFIIKKPVKREVIAADFRDRVVHHLLCSWLFPIFEKQFIYDSYSCRKNKGTLFGINRIRKFVKSCSNNYTQNCWVLKLDIKGFFMHIDKNILYDLIMKGLNKADYENIPDIELCNFLIRQIVFANPLDNAIFRSPRSDWNNLPKDKSLIGISSDKGLPIGNLTSQLFANIYLNPLDHFIKRFLKIRYYGRYVDDMILIHELKSSLFYSIGQIKKFLLTLKLFLHPNKIQIQQFFKGFKFLSAWILSNRVFPTIRIRNNFANVLTYSPSNCNYYFCIFKFMNGIV